MFECVKICFDGFKLYVLYCIFKKVLLYKLKDNLNDIF